MVFSMTVNNVIGKQKYILNVMVMINLIKFHWKKINETVVVKVATATIMKDPRMMVMCS